MRRDGWRSRVRGVLTDPQRRVLVLPEATAWSLPTVETEGFADDALESVRSGFEKFLGTRVAVLRYLARTVDRDAGLLDLVEVLEPLDPDRLPPPGAIWLGRDALADLWELDGDLRTLLLGHLAQLDGPTPPEPPPWAREGWLAEATA